MILAYPAIKEIFECSKYDKFKYINVINEKVLVFFIKHAVFILRTLLYPSLSQFLRSYIFLRFKYGDLFYE